MQSVKEKKNETLNYDSQVNERAIKLTPDKANVNLQIKVKSKSTTKSELNQKGNRNSANKSALRNQALRMSSVWLLRKMQKKQII